ncbi:MAG TPA: GNAT family N-acetyltransferase [Rhodanobacteraceae bacterium]|nr:GNAT family N-acetyltransferase [Rhodanobacteraceae bacterium]
MPRPRASIRHAHLPDLDALVALEEATFTSDRISRRQWRRHLDSASVAVLAADTAGRIDAAAVVCYRRNSRKARLYSLAVDALARGTGTGSALLAAAEADARARGCTSMHLEVHVGNTAAVTLYEHRGYRRGAYVPRFYEDGGDAWRYAKALAPIAR